MANFREQRLFLMARSASRKSPRTRFITSKIQSLGDYGEFPRAKAIPNAFVRVSHTAPYLLYDISVYRRPTMANVPRVGAISYRDCPLICLFVSLSLTKIQDESCEMGPIPFLT
jgi:hypothetical protein